MQPFSLPPESQHLVRGILGEGPFAEGISEALSCSLIGRRKDDEGWNWPRDFADLEARLLLVPRPDGGLAEIIRWHLDLWRCPCVRRLCCGIAGLSEQTVEVLSSRNVFGRMEAEEQSFADWSNHITLIPLHAPLEKLVEAMTKLASCPIATWERHVRESSKLPAILEAISARDVTGLRKAIANAGSQDWDAVCFQHREFGGPHSYAKRIRAWLTKASADKDPGWSEGESLIGPLSSRH